MTGPHDERDDYADDPSRPSGWIDRLFVGILPIHFVYGKSITVVYTADWVSRIFKKVF